MASSLVGSLEKELECSICLCIYTNPKILPCHHTFCCHCLDELAEKSRENRQPIACPDCRALIIDLPRGGSFHDFPTACYLNRLKDIVSVQCQENQGDLKHLQEAAEAAKSRLKETEAKVQERAEVLRKQESKDSDQRRKTRLQIEEIRKAIQQNSRRLIELLKRHEQELLAEVDAFEEDQEKTFEFQRENLKICQGQLLSIIEHLRSVRLRGISEVLKASPSAMSRAQEVLDDLANHQPFKTVSVHYKCDEDMSRRLENSPLGRIYSFKIQGKEVNDMRLKSESCHSDDVNNGGNLETKRIEKERRTTPNVERVRHAPGHATVSVPGQQGANSLPDVHVTVRRPRGYKAVATFGFPGSGKGQFQWPHGVAVNRAGEVAVSDSINSRVQIFSADGHYLREFGKQGTVDRHLHNPVGLACNKAGHIVVIDGNNSGIQVFDPTGRWISMFGQDVLKQPWGVSVTSDDNTVVCDSGEDTVNVFCPEGALLLQFSLEASPQCAIFHDEKYFVSVDSHVIKVFDSRGSHLYDIGEQGNGAGEFYYPWGLAVGTDDLLFTCDSSNNRVQVVTLDGEFVTSFGSHGSGLGQFSDPNFIAVSCDGRLFVTDCCNHRVQVFQPQYSA